MTDASSMSSMSGVESASEMSQSMGGTTGEGKEDSKRRLLPLCAAALCLLLMCCVAIWAFSALSGASGGSGGESTEEAQDAYPTGAASTESQKTTTKVPLTDAELTKLAETRPIRVLFIGDRNFSTISKEQFMIYAQSCLNLVNAGFANINIKLKMTVYDTYVMNEEQDRTHLLEVPGRNHPSVYAHETMNILQRTVVQYPGVNESDMVFVLTRKILLDEKDHTLLSRFHWHIGPCGGRLNPILYFDAPFSYAATRDMWFTILAGIAKSVLCKKNSLALCYKQLIPAYKDDLNSSLCLTTTGTQKAPTFSGIVGFDVDKYCETVAAQFGLESGRKENVSRHCNPPCLRGYTKHAPYLYPCMLSHASGKGCFADDDVLCYDFKCGKRYSDIKALARRNWDLPDSYYDEDAACDKHP